MRELYINRYNKFIEYAKTQHSLGYKETHHIIPKSLGGSNDSDNLIKIPSRMHFIAHWMLWKAHGTDELAYAFWAMCHQKKKGQQNRYSRINSKTYAILKEQRSKLISKNNSERWKDPIWAKQMSDKIREVKNRPEEKEKQSKKMAMQNSDPEFRKKIIEGREKKFANAEWYANYKQIYKTIATKKIKPIVVDGVEYSLVTDVATKYNISIPTVRQRIKSKTAQFKSWNYKTSL